MLKENVKSIFDEECINLKIDQHFYKRICELEASYVNKKQEHIEFFGGTLTGVHTVRFTDDDMDVIFSDILDIDDAVLRDRVYSLGTINPEFKISSNIFNIACVWIMHAIDNSSYLDEKQKHEGKIRICLYMQYKFLTSLLYRYFKYPANPETAAATYAQLSYKYLLKANGSWGAALRARAEEIIAKTSIHFNTIHKLDDDYRLVYMLNDTQSRVKDMLKNIYSVFIKVHNQGTKITNSSTLVESDGEMILKDKTKNIGVYTRYIRTVIPDQNSFIRQELFNVITSIMTTMPPHFLQQTLKWVSSNYSHMKDNSIEHTVEEIMEHAFFYLSENKGILRDKGDIAGLLAKMRGTYMSSRATDLRLMKIKDSVESFVIAGTHSKNASVISATRTGFCLYIILRAFCRQHYQSK